MRDTWNGGRVLGQSRAIDLMLRLPGTRLLWKPIRESLARHDVADRPADSRGSGPRNSRRIPGGDASRAALAEDRSARGQREQSERAERESRGGDSRGR